MFTHLKKYFGKEGRRNTSLPPAPCLPLPGASPFSVDAQVHVPPSTPARGGEGSHRARHTSAQCALVNQAVLPSALCLFPVRGWLVPGTTTLGPVVCECGVGRRGEGEEAARGWAADGKMKFKVTRSLLCARPCQDPPNHHCALRRVAFLGYFLPMRKLRF